MTALDLSLASALAREIFATLAARTADPPGVTRASYGEGERIAHAVVAEVAREWPVKRRLDAAGNQFITLPGEDRSSTVLIG